MHAVKSLPNIPSIVRERVTQKKISKVPALQLSPFVVESMRTSFHLPCEQMSEGEKFPTTGVICSVSWRSLANAVLCNRSLTHSIIPSINQLIDQSINQSKVHAHGQPTWAQVIGRNLPRTYKTLQIGRKELPQTVEFNVCRIE